MQPLERLRELGQSIWLDNITRDLITSGTLQRYIRDLSVTGLTSNPSIFDHAITHSKAYDEEIRRQAEKPTKRCSFELAIQDLVPAADMFAPIHRRTAGVDGWVSLEVSPLLTHDATRTVAEARTPHARANRPNLFIKIPGTSERLPAIEEAIVSGVPFNVTLLFSPNQYAKAADAYMRGLERRIAAGLHPDVRSVASFFVSRWDKARQRLKRCRRNSPTGSASPSRSRTTSRIAICWTRIAGNGCRAGAHVLSGSYSLAPAPRTREPRTCCI